MTLHTVTAHHQYEPLQEGSNTIRILMLDPGERDDPLTGALRTVPMDGAGSFEALSYVWAEAGPAGVAYEILIRDNDDSHERLLTLRGGSIYAALRRLRLPDRPRRIWADQCCINQDDLVERSHQVQQMDKIYLRASCVLVWLGLDPDMKSAAAFGIVRVLDHILESLYVDGESRDPQMELLERYIRENQKHLQSLTDRPWVSSLQIHFNSQLLMS